MTRPSMVFVGVLRRDGLYSSHIIEWRRSAEAGAAVGLEPAARNRRERERDREIAQLRARAEKAEAKLSRYKAALDLGADPCSCNVDSPSRRAIAKFEGQSRLRRLPDLVTYSGVKSRRCRPIVKVLSYEVSVIGM